MSIPKNLKIGDTFEDDGREYIVLEVVAGGYISSADPSKLAPKKGRPRKEPGDARNDKL